MIIIIFCMIVAHKQSFLLHAQSASRGELRGNENASIIVVVVVFVVIIVGVVVDIVVIHYRLRGMHNVSNRRLCSYVSVPSKADGCYQPTTIAKPLSPTETPQPEVKSIHLVLLRLARPACFPSDKKKTRPPS